MQKTFKIKLNKLFISAIIATLLFNCNKETREFKIQDFGAVGDSLTVNTEAIQKAIDACSEKGGGEVVVTDGVYITGTIILKDSVTLRIDENSKLVGSSNPQDYKSIDAFVDATGQTRGNCLIGSKNAKNIAIIGKGIIDGNGEAFLAKNLSLKMEEIKLPSNERKGFGTNRPFLLRFVESSQITLKDVNLRQAAAWACHFYQSKDIIVDAISIYNHANKNNDGIDLDSSHNITIKNCDINTEDDAVCIKSTSPLPTHNVAVKDCKLKSDWGAIKFGTESMGDFFNIKISNCKIYDTRGGGIKLLSVDGAKMYDVTIDSIDMDNVDMPIFIRLGERLRTYRNAEKQEVGSIDNIVIKNINATTRSLENSRVSSPSGIFITGTPNHKISSVLLENISITLPGSEENLILKEVEEQETAYPEFSFFKVLPAYGLYGRHIENLELSKVTFNLLSKDTREEMVLNDVDNQNIK
ncbi:glycoside hydrolase family 28 protein [Flavivirga eckloniae]|uniref:Glycoside hydrolase n=1 Tax=Flavivirga eckloniae TaxID=1803846 RepID=A0A2K9PU07_9FLAO|nr:glycosyl hydrolase family 28 protein [Flavivirga eckloniae]AUP80541.1 glycoside hydrolase [Flavivirga eckloniae]